MAYARVATCNLNQWALDYDGNLERVLESCRQAKAAGAAYRVGPELELTGYGCEDHFYELDTYNNALESLRRLLESDASDGFVVDVGLPIVHRGLRFNCRVICLNRRILLVRPKAFLADGGNYREPRWFTAYRGTGASGVPGDIYSLEDWPLPPTLLKCTGQTTAPFGVAILESSDGVTIAPESCEELFTLSSPHLFLGLAGCDIIVNGSASHHQLRKLSTRVDLIRAATSKGGFVYLYANQQGCDGGRLYFDGCAIAFVNGECVGQTTQFSIADVEVLAVTVDLDDVRSMRTASMSLGEQAQSSAAGARVPRVCMPIPMLVKPWGAVPCPPRPVQYLTAAQEIGLGPACWLWDFLRRSGCGGYLLPLSGGADSAAVAAISGIMCTLVFDAACGSGAGSPSGVTALADLRAVTRDPTFTPSRPSDIAARLLHTVYMGTSNSSAVTRARAEALAGQIGSWHGYASIDAVIRAMLWVLAVFVTSGSTPRFSAGGGSRGEDLALQNLQARLRMVLAYLLAQLLPWHRGGGGYLLVLGSANVDEALRGYMTKYDCSSADLNPIGAISKKDLALFLDDAAGRFGWPALRSILVAPPSAELQPADGGGGAFAVDASAPLVLPLPQASTVPAPPGGEEDGVVGTEHMQLDEADMGMTYAELAWYGRLRKQGRAGPLTMFRKLVACAEPPWAGLSPALVGEKVKRFFTFYAMNRHKMTVLTPSYHAEAYSPDDNRFDQRPFLYRTTWDRDFAAIDAHVAELERRPSRA